MAAAVPSVKFFDSYPPKAFSGVFYIRFSYSAKKEALRFQKPKQGYEKRSAPKIAD